MLLQFQVSLGPMLVEDDCLTNRDEEEAEAFDAIFCLSL